MALPPTIFMRLLALSWSGSCERCPHRWTPIYQVCIGEDAVRYRFVECKRDRAALQGSLSSHLSAPSRATISLMLMNGTLHFRMLQRSRKRAHKACRTCIGAEATRNQLVVQALLGGVDPLGLASCPGEATWGTSSIFCKRWAIHADYLLCMLARSMSRWLAMTSQSNPHHAWSSQSW